MARPGWDASCQRAHAPAAHRAIRPGLQSGETRPEYSRACSPAAAAARRTIIQTRSSETSSPRAITALAAMPEFRSRAHVLPQQVPRRHLGNSIAFHDALGLSAFSGTRWSEQHHRTHVTRGFLRHRLGQSLPSSVSPAPQNQPRCSTMQQPHKFASTTGYNVPPATRCGVREYVRCAA